MKLSSAFTGALAGLLVDLSLLKLCAATPTPSPTLATRKAEASTLSKPAMQRLLYATAHYSVTAGMTNVLNAYNATAWCWADENVEWCAPLLNASASTITRKVIARQSLESNEYVPCVVLNSMANISQEAALDGMIWTKAFLTNMTVAPESDSAAKLDWMMWSLGQPANSSDTATVQHAMDTYQPPPQPSPAAKPDDDDDNDNGAIIAGTAIPGGILAALIAGGSACKDPVVCGGGSGPLLQRLLGSFTGRSPVDSSPFLRYLIKAQENVDEAPLKTVPDEYWEWLQRSENGAVEPAEMTAPSDWTAPTEESISDIVEAGSDVESITTDAGTTFASRGLSRAEVFDSAGNNLKQITLRQATASELEIWGKGMYRTSSGKLAKSQLKKSGYEPYTRLNELGEPMMRSPSGMWHSKGIKNKGPRMDIEYFRPLDLPAMQGEWQALESASGSSTPASEGSTASTLSLTEAGVPVLDSMGQPIVQLPPVAAGAPPIVGSVAPTITLPTDATIFYRVYNAQQQPIKVSAGQPSLLRLSQSQQGKSILKQTTQQQAEQEERESSSEEDEGPSETEQPQSTHSVEPSHAATPTQTTLTRTATPTHTTQHPTLPAQPTTLETRIQPTTQTPPAPAPPRTGTTMHHNTAPTGGNCGPSGFCNVVGSDLDFDEMNKQSQQASGYDNAMVP